MKNFYNLLPILFPLLLFISYQPSPATPLETTVLSSNGDPIPNLYTATAYTIINKATRSIACTRDKLNLENLTQIWQIRPVVNFDSKNPEYELENYGVQKTCLSGKKISFHQTNSTNVFLLSTDTCTKVKACSSKGTIYYGEVTRFSANETISFCGNLNLTCHSATTSKYHSELLQLVNNRHIIPGSFQFEFTEYLTVLQEKYTLTGRLHHFSINNTSLNLKSHSHSKRIKNVWKFGFADDIENCANTKYERIVEVDFKDRQTSTMYISDTSFQTIRHLSSLSISAGISLSIPLLKVSPSIGVEGSMGWSFVERKENQTHTTKLMETSKTVSYTYKSTIIVEPKRIAKVNTFLNVVKNLSIPWTGEMVIYLKPINLIGGGDTENLGEQGTRNALEMIGYNNIQNAEWDEKEKAFKFRVHGNMMANFGTESFVKVTDKPCPDDRGEL